MLLNLPPVLTQLHAVLAARITCALGSFPCSHLIQPCLYFSSCQQVSLIESQGDWKARCSQ